MFHSHCESYEIDIYSLLVLIWCFISPLNDRILSLVFQSVRPTGPMSYIKLYLINKSTEVKGKNPEKESDNCSPVKSIMYR